MKNRYFWKDCLNLCPESSTINQQITFKNCALNTKLQKTLAIWAKIQVFKNLPAKTSWSGDPANFQIFLDYRQKIPSRYKHLISFKKWNKNSTTNYTRKNTCTSSNFFRYFSRELNFWEGGAILSNFQQNQDALRLSQVNLAKVSEKPLQAGRSTANRTVETKF